MRAPREWQRCWACAARVYADEPACAACGAAPRRRLRATDRRRRFRAALRAYQRAGYRVLASAGYQASLAPPRPAPLARLLARLLGAGPAIVYLDVDACGWLRDSDGRIAPPRRAPRRLAPRRPMRRRAPHCAHHPAGAPIARTRHMDAVDAAG